MNIRTLPNLWRLRLAMALALSALASGAIPIHAQEIQVFGFAHAWKYRKSATNLPPAWTAPGHDDSAWAIGPGAFATPYYQNILGLAPVQTEISQVVSYNNVTHFFRTHFDFNSNAAGITLVASNLLDDGAVIYLNGVEVGRFGMPPGPVVLTTLPTRSGEVAAHGVDVLRFVPTNLIRGENVLAAELHSIPGQTAFGMSLSALIPIPIVITKQPESLIVSNGWTTLTVEATGFPLSYQWRRNGNDLFGATSASLILGGLQPADSGDYTVVVSNTLGSVTSSVATLVVVTDTQGPELLSAGVRVIVGVSSNQIDLTFSEAVASSTIARECFTVTRLGTTNTVPIIGTQVNNRLTRLLVGGPGWIAGSNYYLTVNHVRDTSGNVIAPDTIIGITWPYTTTNLFSSNTEWSYHSAAFFDPDVFSQPWQSSGYVEGSWWARGRGVLYGGTVVPVSCPGPFQTDIGYQPEPSLFRTTFKWSAGLGNTARLEPTFVVDDGLVLYLNGTEIMRANMGSSVHAIAASTRALANTTTLTCISPGITVTNLVAGTNYLAVAVCQSTNAFDSDSVFGLRLQASGQLPSPIVNGCLPPCPPPIPFASRGLATATRWRAPRISPEVG